MLHFNKLQSFALVFTDGVGPSVFEFIQLNFIFDDIEYKGMRVVELRKEKFKKNH